MREALTALALAAIVPTAGAAQEEVAVAEALAGTHVHGLAVVEGGLLVATHHGMWRLDPDSGTMERLGESRQDFMGLAAAGTDRLLASGHPEEGGNSGVLVSTDGAESWSRLADGVGGPVDFHQMTVSPADAGTAYGAYAGTIQRSGDGGAAWEVVAEAPAGLIDLAASPEGADVLYAATETGLLRSADGGASWTATALAGAPVSLVEATSGGLYAFVVGRGLMRSDVPGSDDWAEVGPAPGGEVLLHLAVEGTTAYAATATGALLASGDGGATWGLAGG